MDTIKFAKVKEGGVIPSKRLGDGCYDVYACFEDESIRLQPHETKLIPTGICSTFDSKYRVGIRERGSNTKSGLKTSAGQIDSNYTGEWFVALYNSNSKPVEITKKVSEVEKSKFYIKVPYTKAIAQFAVEFVPEVEVVETSLEEIQSIKTERGDGKLGSSGK